MLIKGIKSEFKKGFHSFYYIWHILLPVVAIIVIWFYYINRNASRMAEAEVYYILLTAVFPIGIAWMSAVSAGWEEENHFQHFLTSQSRENSWYSKYIALNLSGIVTAFIAVAAGQIVLLKDFSVMHIVLMFTVLVTTNLIYYAIHLIINLRFGKTISILISFCGSVIGVLLLTGLGDGCWQWIPYSINGHLCECLLAIFYTNTDVSQLLIYHSEIGKAVIPIILWVVGIQLIGAIWVRQWEGRTVTE